MSMLDKLEAFLNAEQVFYESLDQEEDKWLRDLLVELMNKHPEVTGIGWTAYAPYFNDGDPCSFSLNEVYVVGEEWDPEDESAELGRDLTNDSYSGLHGAYMRANTEVTHEYSHHSSEEGYVYKYTGPAEKVAEAQRLAAIENEIVGLINSLGDILEHTVGDPQRVWALRRNGEVEISITTDVDHD